jgi:hypothetical protein
VDSRGGCQIEQQRSITRQGPPNGQRQEVSSNSDLIASGHRLVRLGRPLLGQSLGVHGLIPELLTTYSLCRVQQQERDTAVFRDPRDTPFDFPFGINSTLKTANDATSK